MGVLFIGMNFNTELKVSDNLEGNITFVSIRTDKSVEIEALIKEFEEINPKVNVTLELIGDAQSILQRKAVAAGDRPAATAVVISPPPKSDRAPLFRTEAEQGSYLSGDLSEAVAQACCRSFLFSSTWSRTMPPTRTMPTTSVTVPG